ncbi:MAG TPA: hypothetical protein VLV78_00385 [Thermoanaerobaculia bacterium]|nr:hypothetical protein [Thermoanaerobaculia bacterium]
MARIPQLLRSAHPSVDGLSFCGALGFALIYVLHGKPLADWLFNEGATRVTASFHNVRVYLTLTAVVTFWACLRYVPWSQELRYFLGVISTILGPVAIQLQSTSASAMIFVLHIYLCVIAFAIILVEPVFGQTLDNEFWRRFFAPATKAVGYMFTLFSAILAVLQYVSKGLNESIPGYLTSLAYPIGALVISLAMVVYWLLSPAWRKYMATFQRGAA